jgi:branched-chain amino acid transport system substrate-binding protein
MKRFQSIFTIVLGLFLSLFIYGSSLAGALAPATTPHGVVAPPEGELLNFDSPFEGGQGDVNSKSQIKIGLLIQDSSSIEALQGAELAIINENRKGGYNGRMFELVVKSMEGPWGTGSKQAVDMIFTDEVVAIVGSHDGRNAHLVEQATTKSHITFLSAWAGDPTLSQAFTPWFFNCVPNDNQQAEILEEEIYKKKKFSKVAVVTDDNYDANSAFKSFIRKSAEAGSPNPISLKIENSENDFTELAGLIGKKKADCLLLFTEPVKAEKIIYELRKTGIPLPVYGPLYLLSESSSLESYPEISGNLKLLSSGDWFLKEKSEFAAGYRSMYGNYPCAPAAYAFDAMTAMINAVKTAGGDMEKVHKALMVTEFKGTTGRIKFDEKGNRIPSISNVK